MISVRSPKLFLGALAVVATAMSAFLVSFASADLPEGCLEQANAIADTNNCPVDGIACKAKTKTVTFHFDLEGDLIVIKASGGVELEVVLDDGCDPNTLPNRYRDFCDTQLGTEFTSASGSVKGLKQKDCPLLNVYSCVDATTAPEDIGEKPAVKGWLNIQWPGKKLKEALTWPVTHCSKDALLQNLRCPGTAEGKTYYYVIDATCLP